MSRRSVLIMNYSILGGISGERFYRNSSKMFCHLLYRPRTTTIDWLHAIVTNTRDKKFAGWFTIVTLTVILPTEITNHIIYPSPRNSRIVRFLLYTRLEAITITSAWLIINFPYNERHSARRSTRNSLTHHARCSENIKGESFSQLYSSIVYIYNRHIHPRTETHAHRI